jgi:hypothetical protein
VGADERIELVVVEHDGSTARTASSAEVREDVFIAGLPLRD